MKQGCHSQVQNLWLQSQKLLFFRTHRFVTFPSSMVILFSEATTAQVFRVGQCANYEGWICSPCPPTGFLSLAHDWSLASHHRSSSPDALKLLTDHVGNSNLESSKPTQDKQLCLPFAVKYSMKYHAGEISECLTDVHGTNSSDWKTAIQKMVLALAVSLRCALTLFCPEEWWWVTSYSFGLSSDVPSGRSVLVSWGSGWPGRGLGARAETPLSRMSKGGNKYFSSKCHGSSCPMGDFTVVSVP